MNNQRRIKLRKAQDILEAIKAELEEILEQEEEARDNLPESLQYSEKYERAEASCDALDEAINMIQETIDSIEQACEQ